MKYSISIEGQTIEMPEEIAGDDAKLKSALAPHFPGVANAKFMRSEPKEDVVTVTVIKQAGTKGLFPTSETLTKLLKAKEGVNPVKKLFDEMDQRTMNSLSAEAILQMDGMIEKTLSDGSKEKEHLEATLFHLKAADSQPAASVVVGF